MLGMLDSRWTHAEHAESMLSMLGTGSTDTAVYKAEPGCDACSCGRRCSTG